MTKIRHNALSTQIFIGILMTKGVRVHLNESLAWRKDALNATPPLSIMAFDGQDYLGCPCPMGIMPIHSIKEMGASVLEHIQTYCPKLPVNSQKLLLISQEVIA